MKLIELIIDENDELNGIDAISVVENPAIEEDFVALNSDTQEVKLQAIDNEKRILMGPALIPNKPIFRRGNDEDYYIFFTEETVRKASELYLKRGNQGNATLEHEMKLSGLTLIESWIKEDDVHDKSVKLGLNAPIGTWMVTMKVDNDEVWNDYVKTGKVKGFSIEGKFADKMERPQEKLDELLNAIDEMQLEELKQLLSGVELETYNDYPESARNNAKKVLRWREEHGDEVKGMTRVGWTRANQLAKGENLSRSTIARMASFKRHQKNAEINPEYKSTPWKDKGYVAWLGWGGTSGINWAINKLKSIDN